MWRYDTRKADPVFFFPLAEHGIQHNSWKTQQLLGLSLLMRLGALDQEEQWGPSSPGTQMCHLKVLSLHNYSSILEKYCQDLSAVATVLRKLVPELTDILGFKRNR